MFFQIFGGVNFFRPVLAIFLRVVSAITETHKNGHKTETIHSTMIIFESIPIFSGSENMIIQFYLGSDCDLAEIHERRHWLPVNM